ncbi:hypothetical protein BGZ72_000289 [Mortierella alpina]|nr:hypothetical protein BGZ72_000289 [Mortierella alpina]
MRFNSAAVAFVALASTAAAQADYSLCGVPENHLFQMKSLTWSPSPACIGQDFCAVGTGVLSASIIAPARLNLNGKYLGRVVYTDNQDLCALLAAEGTPCPVAAGSEVTLKGCVKIKETAPVKIPVSFRSTAINGDNREIFCTMVLNAEGRKCA